VSETQPSPLSQIMKKRFEDERSKQIAALKDLSTRASADRVSVQSEIESLRKVVESMRPGQENPSTTMFGSGADLLLQGFALLENGRHDFPNVDLFLDFVLWLAEQGARPVFEKRNQQSPQGLRAYVEVTWDTDLRLQKIYGL
jgi:hypothetical protein